MSIAVIGKNGQLATELSRLSGAEVVLLEREEIDITYLESVRVVLTDLEPTSIINAAAYTAVDKAESDEANARLINATAVEHLATVAKELAIPLVHVSTDYVFNGDKGSPYLPDDEYEPLGVYGQTKAEGEQAISRIYPEGSCILRTSWVYSSHGNNFVKTMLRLMAEKPQLGVIDDQIGSPTWAKGLARACVEAASQRTAGIYHWSDEGVCSWYDFAIAIQQLGLEKGLLEQAVPVKPIPSSAYPTPAKRPHYSVLDKTLTRETFTSPLNHWREQLSAMMDELV